MREKFLDALIHLAAHLLRRRARRLRGGTRCAAAVRTASALARYLEEDRDFDPVAYRPFLGNGLGAAKQMSARAGVPRSWRAATLLVLGAALIGCYPDAPEDLTCWRIAVGSGSAIACEVDGTELFVPTQEGAVRLRWRHERAILGLLDPEDSRPAVYTLELRVPWSGNAWREVDLSDGDAYIVPDAPSLRVTPLGPAETLALVFAVEEWRANEAATKESSGEPDQR